MQHSTLLWLALLAAGVLTYLIRTAPLFFARRFLSEESIVTRFLGYASYGVLGGLISLTTLKLNNSTEYGIFGIKPGIIPTIVALIVVCGVTYKTKNILICLVSGLVVYFGLYRMGW
ncbi:MAG: AzlD domain-containing protein [SAR324 cluster bacterium]|nr:AzlD domain-containing protein [SAR324 cluster bacterium]